MQKIFSVGASMAVLLVLGASDAFAATGANGANLEMLAADPGAGIWMIWTASILGASLLALNGFAIRSLFSPKADRIAE